MSLSGPWKSFSETINFDNVTRKSDVLLWRDFLDGNLDALSELYHLNIDSLFLYGCQFSPDKELVKDCIQDVFFQLINDRKKLSLANSVKSYLFACLRRKLHKKLIHAKKYPFEDILDHEGFSVQVQERIIPLESTLTFDQKKLVEKCCNELPLRQREIIFMRFYEDLSYFEIAEILGLANSKSVRTMMYRGLKSLAASLAPFKSQFFLMSLFF